MKIDDAFQVPTKLKKEEYKGFIILPFKADRPLCVLHLTLMTADDDFVEKGIRFSGWFCIDCFEDWNARRRAEGKPELTMGGDFVGKTEREFFNIPKDKIN